MLIVAPLLLALAPFRLAQAGPIARPLHVYDAADCAAAGELPDRAGNQPLTYKPVGGPAAAEGVRRVEGRRPGTQAIRIDNGCLEGRPFDLSAGGFTLSAWVRTGGPGKQRGNAGSTNGTLFSIGSGYWDGWRLTLSYPQQTLSFSIGRPKPRSAAGISGGAVGDGTWYHLATVWDGREMRLYVQGRLAAAGPFEEKYAPGAKFRIGFANSGVGSLVLDLDTVAIYGQALSSVEILRMAHPGLAVDASQADLLEAAGKQELQKSPERLKEALTPILDGKTTPVDLRAIAQLSLAEAWQRNGKPRHAAESLAAAWRLPNAAAAHRAAAQSRLAEMVGRVEPPAIPAELCDELLKAGRLSPQQALSVRVSGARRHFHSGQLEAARQEFEQLAQEKGTEPADRLQIEMELGHIALAAKQYSEARRRYDRIVASPDAGPAWKSLASLRIAECYVREGKPAEARRALTAVEEHGEFPSHQRAEARQRREELEGRVMADDRMRPLGSPTPGAEFFVVPGGSDENPGSRSRPFATIERARDAIRKMKADGGLPAGGVVVNLAPGEYVVKQTFGLSVEDSGTSAAPIVYRGELGQTRFRGGRRLKEFRGVDDPAVRQQLPEEARTKVVVCHLDKEGIEDVGPFSPGGYNSGKGFGTRPLAWLYCNGEAMVLARWPNRGFLKVGKLLGSEPFEGRGRASGNREGYFTFEGDRPLRWQHAPDGWLYGYWYHDWADSYEKIASIDAAAGAIRLAKPGPGYGFREGQRYYAVNLLCELDQPGEWYLDRAARRLYFYPPVAMESAVIELSEFAEPFVSVRDAGCIRFQGITWELGRGDGVQIRGGEDCVLAGCTIRQLTGTAVVVAGGRGHKVVGCDLHTLGRGGVVLLGGDRKTLTPAGHLVENCHIYDLSRLHHTYTPAVQVTGVGCRIAHNLMHHSTSSALNVTGNDHEVDFNEVHHVVLESDDQGGLDSFGNPTFQGIVYRYNYWHDIGSGTMMGQAGIRFDDAICGQLVYGNVFCRCSTNRFGGLQIHGGKDNIVDNNLFISCDTAISFSPWPKSRWGEHIAKPEYTQPPKGVDIHSPPYATRYPGLARLAEDPNVNQVWRNLVVDCGQFLDRDRGIQQLVDNCVAASEPGFVDAGKGNFAFKPGSQACDWLNFRPIPVAKIGLYRDALRARWPPREWPKAGAFPMGER